MSKINQINNDEVMGIVFHVFDYYRFSDIYSDLFNFFDQSSVYNRSIRCLMNNCNTTGIDVDLNVSEIRIYPNPTNGIITVQGKEIQTVEIINISGQIINQLRTNTEEFIIDMSEQPAGIYIVKIETNKGILAKRIILR